MPTGSIIPKINVTAELLSRTQKPVRMSSRSSLVSASSRIHFRPECNYRFGQNLLHKGDTQCATNAETKNTHHQGIQFCQNWPLLPKVQSLLSLLRSERNYLLFEDHKTEIKITYQKGYHAAVLWNFISFVLNLLTICSHANTLVQPPAEQQQISVSAPAISTGCFQCRVNDISQWMTKFGAAIFASGCLLAWIIYYSDKLSTLSGQSGSAEKTGLIDNPL